jgi:hypothetical protein
MNTRHLMSATAIALAMAVTACSNPDQPSPFTGGAGTGQPAPQPDPNPTPDPSPEPDPEPTPDPSPDPDPTPDPSPDPEPTPGPDAGELTDPNIDSSAAAGTALDISSPDSAARAFVAGAGSALTAGDFGGDIASPQPALAAKVLSNCGGGGTVDATTSSSGSMTAPTTTSVSVFDQCVNGNLRQDGRLEVVSMITLTPGFAPESATFDIVFGTDSGNYTSEILNPAEDRFLSQLRGDLDGNLSFEGNAPSSGSFSYVLDIAVSNLAPGRAFRADSTIGTPANRFTFDLDFLSNGDSQATLAGPFRTVSTCGTGEGTLSTNTPLLIDGNTGQTKGGEIALMSGGQTSTYTYNTDGSVTVTAGGQSQTYTEAELAALCDL